MVARFDEVGLFLYRTDIPPYSLNNSTVFYFVAECPEVTVLVEDVCSVQATKPSYVTRT